MTDEAYHAKNWLMRADELELQWKRTARQILVIKDKIDGGVANYYGLGSGDSISAQARHEDLLLEYSMLQEQLEEELSRCLYEDNITLRVIDRIDNPLYRAILIARYICRSDWKTITKSFQTELKRTRLKFFHNQALEELALILDSNSLEIVNNTTI